MDNKSVDLLLRSISVRVNDINCLMLLDTGANQTMLSREFCKKHSLTGKSYRIAPKNTNIEDTADLRHLRGQLSVGSVTFDNFKFLELGSQQICPFKTGTPLAGILGTDFLNRFNYSLNLLDGLLELGVTERHADVERNRVPMTIRNNNLYIDLDIHNRPFEFLLDTGRDAPSIAEKNLTSLRGETSSANRTWWDINRLHKETAKLLKLTSVRWGSFSYKGVTLQAWGDVNILSASMLRPLIMTIYPSRKYMTLAENPNYTSVRTNATIPSERNPPASESAF
ncbi:MAG: retropepsin-like domain-containing protein [Phycisphaeraceae bacterium]|nr:retropepsin-like domain-containing protein [Phycisphaeraceae bacterium]